MRTIRDNYYIITGHTYEEYIKKYRHGIGKGKLLSFTEEETKFLKKHKHYWEVIGPDGKTLYCQVNKLKPKHIIIPAIIAILAGGGTLAGIYLPKLLKKPFNGQVTETQWQAALENIVNVNKKNTLNYTTKGTFSIGEYKSSNEVIYELEYSNLIVDGDYEIVTDITNNDTLYLCEYGGMPIKYSKKSDKTVAYSSMMRNYLATPFGDIYAMEGFKFDTVLKKYIYQWNPEKESEFDYLRLEIAFESSEHIGQIECEYRRNVDKIAFKSNVEYTYSNASLEKWLDEEEAKKIIEKITIGTGGHHELYVGLTRDTITIEKEFLNNFGEKKPFMITLDFSKTINEKVLPTGLSYFRYLDENGQVINFWPSDVLIVKNGTQVKYGSDEDEYKWIYNSSTKYVEGFVLNKPLTSTDIISIKLAISPDYFVNNGSIKITKE